MQDHPWTLTMVLLMACVLTTCMADSLPEETELDADGDVADAPTIPTTMRGIACPGGVEAACEPSELRVVEGLQVPWGANQPDGDFVLVRVAAFGLNRADILQRKGLYPPPTWSHTQGLGLELSGTVVALSEQAKKRKESQRWKVGANVMALVIGGAYAEYAAVPMDHLMPVPTGMALTTAAGIPETFLTAYQALYVNSKLEDWEASSTAAEVKRNVIVHACGSGVGTAALSIISYVHKVNALSSEAVVLGTASKGKERLCLEAGATHFMDRKTQPRFDEEMMRLTNGTGADIVIDFVAGPYLQRNMEALAQDGIVVILGGLGGWKVDGATDLRPLFAKRGSIVTSKLRNRSDAHKARLVQEMVELLHSALDSQQLGPEIESVLPWTHVGAAHAKMEDNATMGKVVFRVE